MRNSNGERAAGEQISGWAMVRTGGMIFLLICAVAVLVGLASGA